MLDKTKPSIEDCFRISWKLLLAMPIPSIVQGRAKIMSFVPQEEEISLSHLGLQKA